MIEKVPTAIPGFDEISRGGLPKNRVTAILGGPGSGKTILALQFLVNRIQTGAERGIFVAFEEPTEQIVANGRSFDWPLDDCLDDGLQLLDARLPSTVLLDGNFDLNGLLAQVQHRLDASKGNLVVFDGLDILLDHLESPTRIREEMFRLRDWLHKAGVTILLTAKVRRQSSYDFLQYLADCVIRLQHELSGGTAVRSLAIAKYRGTHHSANGYPMTITDRGIEIPSETGRELEHEVSTERIGTGVERLDRMLSGGYFRGSATLISGAPGTAKTTLGGAFADAACKRGEKTLYVSFDEAADQIIRNLQSVGLDLQAHLDADLLTIFSTRARATAAESHIVGIRRLLHEHEARNLVVDPVSALLHAGGNREAESSALQLVDLAKRNGITILQTTLLGNAPEDREQSPIGLSTVADTWIHLSYSVQAGERNRALTIIKSRGTSHSNQVRELLLSDEGISLADVYTAGGEVLMGTLRWEKEREQKQAQEEAERKRKWKARQAELAVAEAEARLKTLELELNSRRRELQRLEEAEERHREKQRERKREVRNLRRGDDPETSR